MVFYYIYENWKLIEELIRIPLYCSLKKLADCIDPNGLRINGTYKRWINDYNVMYTSIRAVGRYQGIAHDPVQVLEEHWINMGYDFKIDAKCLKQGMRRIRGRIELMMMNIRGSYPQSIELFAEKWMRL